MKARVAGTLLLGLFAFVPSVVALVPFEATLESETPFAFEGILLGTPDASYRSHLEWRGGLGNPDEPLIRSDKARLRLERWAPMDPPTTGLVRLQTSEAPANITIRGVGAVGAPQAHVLHEASSSAASIHVAVTRCAIEPAAAEETLRFPTEARSVGEPHYFAMDAGHVAADCVADAYEDAAAAQSFLYGLDLLVETPGENPRRVRTGTFDEPVAPGVNQTVTQILVVTQAGAPLRIGSRANATISIRGQGLLGVGDLSVDEANGRLRWGGLARTGALDPFEATGRFHFESNGPPQVEVRGDTLDGPAAASSLAATRVRPLPIVAAGLAILGLAALVGVLYSRLQPERLLHHKVRAELFDVVAREPGIERNAAARQLGLRPAHAFYHVSLLVRGGHLTLHRIAGRTALFPANQGYRGRETKLVFMRRRSARRLVELLQAQPGLDQAGLSAHLGFGQSRIARLLGSLQAAGLVRSERVGRRLRYFLAAP